MNLQERTEVREMIQGVLSGWHESSVEREKLIYLSLNNIDSHLEKLNGKVASHEKTILENLPHSVAHCPQAPTITEIRDKVMTIKSTKEASDINWGKVITYGTFILGMIMAWQGYKQLSKENSQIKSEVQITNDAIFKGQTRGQTFDPFAKDTIK